MKQRKKDEQQAERGKEKASEGDHEDEVVTLPHWPPCEVIDRDIASFMAEMGALRTARKREKRQWLRIDRDGERSVAGAGINVPHKAERVAWTSARKPTTLRRKRVRVVVEDEEKKSEPSFVVRVMAGLMRMIFSIVLSVLVGYAVVTLAIGQVKVV